MFSLEGKRILITGASKGLGYVCAKALAQQGARLVLVARSRDLLDNLVADCRNSQNHLGIDCDLTDLKLLDSLIGKTKDFLGDIDVVLHVVGGGLGLRSPMLGADDLMKLFTLNVVVASQINRIVLPDMIERGFGNLVHVGSIASTEAVGSVGYNTSKAALAAYVKSLGREMAGSGVVVTGILPGGFYAPGNSWQRLEAQKPDVVKKFIKDRLPRGFLGEAEEIIPAIFLLCSESAAMMAGCMIPIDAGEARGYTLDG